MLTCEKGTNANIYNAMLGNFQTSQLRIEVKASEELLRESLLNTSVLRQWLWIAKLDDRLPLILELGSTYSSWILGVEIHHEVETVNDNCLRLLLSKGIDGYHEWYWGKDWVQSRLEGISLLPLNLAQSLTLLCLRDFLRKKSLTTSPTT